MGLLSELEEQGEVVLEEYLQKSLQDALLRYHPLCPSCELAMHRHHFYPRRFLTRHGEINLRVPVFKCPSCGSMSSGIELIGKEEGRKCFSKNSARRPSI